MNLFTSDSPWTQAESHVSVFTMTLIPFTGGTQIPAFTDAQLQQVFSFLNPHNISFGIDFGPLIPSGSCGTGIEGFTGEGTAQYVADRIKNNGGTLKYVAMDEPFFFGNVYNGAGGCQWAASQIADNAVTSLNVLNTAFPGLIIGDIEPVPAVGPPIGFSAMPTGWTRSKPQLETSSRSSNPIQDSFRTGLPMWQTFGQKHPGAVSRSG